MESYWKDLLSMSLRVFQDQKNADAVFVLKNGIPEVEFDYHDNWDGGIDYWDIVFRLKYHDYTLLTDRKDAVERDILAVLEQLHTDKSNPISKITIQPLIERYIDWNAVFPATKESVIRDIEAEIELLTNIATGKSYKDEGVEEEYRQRHRTICSIAGKAGFEYPIDCNSLAEWWVMIKAVGGYSERRAYISQLFAPVLKLLTESDCANSPDFSIIASRSGTIQKAVNDATVFIREGVFDSAVDRIHTAFHGYLQQLLTEHQMEFGKDDSISSLYSKLYTLYGTIIDPPEVALRVKTILRSGAGLISAVNELRNNNTIAHPNGSLIQEREAQLVIELVKCMVDYIEKLDRSLV